MELVTLYRANRIDAAEKFRPYDLATDFIDTLAGLTHQDYTPARRMSIEFEYRWWLTDPHGMHSTWEEEEWDTMWQQLAEVLNSDLEAKEMVLRAVDPYDD